MCSIKIINNFKNKYCWENVHWNQVRVQKLPRLKTFIIKTFLSPHSNKNSHKSIFISVYAFACIIKISFSWHATDLPIWNLNRFIDLLDMLSRSNDAEISTDKTNKISGNEEKYCFTSGIRFIRSIWFLSCN